MFKDKNINIELDLNNNSYIYYDIIIYPILEEVYNYYYVFNNPIKSLNKLKDKSEYFCKIINYNQNKDLKKFCNKTLLDIFDFLTCINNDFYNLQSIIENDYIYIKNILIKSNSSLIYTLSTIFYFIIFFKKTLLNLYIKK